MSKYSVVMHELAEINLCLRNLDEAPQSTNQSRHANKAVHPISSHPAPGSAALQSRLRRAPGWTGDWGWVCLLIHLSACESPGGEGNRLQKSALGSV